MGSGPDRTPSDALLRLEPAYAAMREALAEDLDRTVFYGFLPGALRS